MVVLDSVLDTIYWRLKWVSSVNCLPSERCITVIKAVSAYPIQTLKLLAKSVLCLVLPHQIDKPQQMVLLDDVEVQTCLNLLQGRTPFYQAIVLPICSYMGDLVKASDENKCLFLQQYGHVLLTKIKYKSESIVVLEEFERLESLLASSERHTSTLMSTSTKEQCHGTFNIYIMHAHYLL